MAKKNVRDDPQKTQVTENPQMSDIVLVLDKMELLIQAVSEINKNGKYSTVPADKEHQNSFLKIDRYATFFENFLKNFWSQLKDPTHFGLFTMKEEEFDKPEVKQAIEDLAEGKKTKAVEEFLKKYEITPKNQTEQSINNQNSEEMAKKNQTQQPVVEANDQQNNQYRYNESMINWDQLKNFGLSREYLQERGLLDSMLKGYKTNQLVPINLNFGSAVLRTDARLSLQQSNTGEVVLAIHGIRKQPELERPYFGHIFSEEDKKNLLETGNMGRVVELKGRNGEYIPSFINLLLSDIQMPNTDGFKLLELLRKSRIGNSKDIPIVAMTARSESEREALLEAGFDGCIFKPFSMNELLKVIASVVKGREPGSDTDFSMILANVSDKKKILRTMIESCEKDIVDLKIAMTAENRESMRSIAHRMFPMWEMVSMDEILLAYRNVLKDSDCDTQTVLNHTNHIITHIEHLIEDAGNEIERIADEEKNIDSRG